jgi:spermidine/putrescine transport system permease protein
MKRKHLAIPYSVYLIAFIIIPTLLILINAFIVDGHFSLANFYTGTYNEKSVWLAIWNTLWTSLLATVMCLLIGYPLAYILSTIKFKNKGFLVMLLLLPMWINFLLRVYAFAEILRFFKLLNNYKFAITFGLVYDFLPFMVLPLYTFLSKMDKNLLDASSDLGAKWHQSFLKVTFPLSLPAVFSGVIMVFMPMLSSFAVTDFLSDMRFNTLGSVIHELFYLGEGAGYGPGSALSLLLMIVVVISMLLNKGSKTEKGNL